MGHLYPKEMKKDAMHHQLKNAKADPSPVRMVRTIKQERGE